MSVTPSSPQTVTPHATLDEAAGTYVDYTIDRPAFGEPSLRVTWTATAANRTSDSDSIDVPAQELTQALAMRILRVSETATQMVERVEVASPNTGMTVTVAYNAGGLTVSPSSGGTLTSTTLFSTTNHIDYTITRPAFGAGAKRIAFTASATGLVDATDGIDVSEVGRDTQSLTPVGENLFTYNSGGPSTLNMWLVWSWAAFSYYRPEGTIVNVPASSSMALPPTAVMTQVAGGSLAARTRYGRIGYTKNGMVHRVGAETSIAVLINNLAKFTSPAAVAGFDGWVPLMGTAPDGEFFMPYNPGFPTTPVPFGTDWTEPTGGASFGGTPFDVTNMPNGITATGRAVSTSYFYYPYWDVAAGFVAFQNRGDTAPSAAGAQTQNLDGRTPLTLKNITGVTPAAGLPGTGGAQGGKLV